MTDVLTQFQTCPDGIKRLILRKYQKLTRDENLRNVNCTKWVFHAMIPDDDHKYMYAMFECDGIHCLVRTNPLYHNHILSCGVLKVRGLGLHYGIDITCDDDGTCVFQTIAPTSSLFTNEELLRITRALCNILRFMKRITRPDDQVREMLKNVSIQVQKAILMFTHKQCGPNVLAAMTPRRRVRKLDHERLSSDMIRIIQSILAPRTLMMWV